MNEFAVMMLILPVSVLAGFLVFLAIIFMVAIVKAFFG